MAIDHDATTRKELLELAARVPDEELPTAKRMLLSLLVDPMWLSIESARVEQEELTPEARAALDNFAENLGKPCQEADQPALV